MSIAAGSALILLAGLCPPAYAQTGEWGWMGGSNSVDVVQKGVYGMLGTPAAENIPGNRFGASSWTDSGGHLWLFGGDGYDASGTVSALNDLWEFDPSTNEWAWMGGSNTVNEPGVYGTLGTPATGNIPRNHFGASSWTDGSGNFWLFGGQGYDVNSDYFLLNDLWEFNPSTNEWGWMGGSNSLGVGQKGVYGTLGTPAPGNIPGARFGASSWTDCGGHLWLFGGDGYDASGNTSVLNDVWEFDPSTNEWAWMGGSNTGDEPGVYGTLGTPAAGNIPGNRSGASSWTDGSGNFWLFGGLGYGANGNTSVLNDLWEFNPSTKEWAWMDGSNTGDEPGVYGTLGTPAAGNIPRSRFGASSWTDGSGHLWLFGGEDCATSCSVSALNDLWEFDPSTNEWAWMGGSNTVNEPGVYGTLGTPATGNIPRNHFGASSWTDGSGNFWLFGGQGYDVNSDYFLLNDLWEFNPSTNEWGWMGGSNSLGVGQKGVYGTLGTPAPGNIPGARFGASSWTDCGGHLWLFGGDGYDASGNTSVLNDVWEFDPSTNEWAWMGGSNTGDEPGVYGTLGTPAAGNIPRNRYGASSWTDGSGNFWLFGGQGYDVNNSAYHIFNDLWEFWPGVTPAALTSPTPSSTLAGASATFTWSAGVDVTLYEFRLGTTAPGSSNVYNSAETATTALTTGVVSNIPTTGAKLYARLYSKINGAWQYNDYTYTEFGTPVPAALTSPMLGSTLTGSSATFTWSAGVNVTLYEFRLGTTGPRSTNLYNSAEASTTALTSGLISNIPTTGAKLYARLYSKINGAWQYNDYTYKEFGTPVPAALASPTPGSTLTGSSATFTWSAGVDVTLYEFRLGTTAPGSSNVYNSAETATTALTTGVVSNIPTTGAKLYARLYSKINGAWQYTDYTYTESVVPAALTSPTPGSTLTGSSATFTWSAGVGADYYDLRLGTTGAGSGNVYNSPLPATAALTSGLVSNIPTNGATLYARIYSWINGAWQYNDYTYTEAQ